ncbi:RHS repeat domain-containing protein, partial [Paucidesulfovibrio gracilis]|uniref:RHS repeat domain-containing protein n=1 Tax=Paucidesulfovibrio gracilis TaxID=47158 RepID=UPI002E128A29
MHVSVFEMSLKHDRDGRIVEKTEIVAGRPVVWKYAYDKAGRLFEAHLDNRLICQCYYDRDGRRQRDYFPVTVGPHYRDYRYNLDNRLMSAGNNGFTHDENGFRSIWSNGSAYHLYEYAPDYRLLKMEVENQNSVYTFRHDEEGRRAAKYCNGQLVEAYQWLDFVRLRAFHDGRMGYEFVYGCNERLPSAMRRKDGAVFTLHYDQVGSLRVVADTDGDLIKVILYDPFGGIIQDTNSGFRVPIGFTGGLHDRDLGFVRFGWRDYDTFTGRWTAPDPIGD